LLDNAISLGYGTPLEASYEYLTSHSEIEVADLVNCFTIAYFLRSHPSVGDTIMYPEGLEAGEADF
jgi:hypothetical protein